MTFIERLTELMNEKGLNRAQLTEILKIGKNQIKYWEKNGTLPESATLLKMSDFFEVSTDYILGKTDIRKTTTPTEQPLSLRDKYILSRFEGMSDEEVSKALDYLENLKNQDT